MTDVELADHYAECLGILDIPYSRHDRPGDQDHYRHKWSVDIQSGRGIRKLHDVAIIQCTRKVLALDGLVASYGNFRDGCNGCGCPYDQKSDSCYPCKKRHQYRARIAKKAMEESG